MGSVVCGGGLDERVTVVSTRSLVFVSDVNGINKEEVLSFPHAQVPLDLIGDAARKNSECGT